MKRFISKLKKKHLYIAILIVVLAFLLVLVWYLILVTVAGRVPEEDVFIVDLLSEEYPEYSVKGVPAYLDAHIRVKHKNRSSLNKEELEEIRTFFRDNYSGGYWVGIPN